MSDQINTTLVIIWVVLRPAIVWLVSGAVMVMQRFDDNGDGETEVSQRYQPSEAQPPKQDIIYHHIHSCSLSLECSLYLRGDFL